MKGRDTRIIIAEMVDALVLIRQYPSQLSEEELRRNVMLQDALTRRIEIVGEAASQLDEAFQRQYPDIRGRRSLGCATARFTAISG